MSDIKPETIEAAAKGVYEEHTQLGALIKDLQEENKRLKEKKARAEEKIRALSKDNKNIREELVSWANIHKTGIENCQMLTEMLDEAKKRNSILEAAMAGFGAILRGVRP